MAWCNRLNGAMEYIEEHLADHMDLEQAARIAGSSLTAFQRTFSIIADMPLSEYIRRRRLTLAAFELKDTAVKVIDVALKYGYDSPEAFARAFRAVHGASPSEARREGVELKAFPRISFLLTIKGVTPMDYRIETKEAFTVYGIEGIFSTEEGKNLKDIPQMWMRIWQDGSGDELIRSAGVEQEGELCPLNAVCGYEDLPGNTFPYMIFAHKSPKSNTAAYKEVEIPAATWAIFRTGNHTEEETSRKMQELIKRVYTEWLPTALYQKIDGYDLELYYEKKAADEGKRFYCETWIRVSPQ